MDSNMRVLNSNVQQVIFFTFPFLNRDFYYRVILENGKTLINLGLSGMFTKVVDNLLLTV
jgi:hypothetical protein